MQNILLYQSFLLRYHPISMNKTNAKWKVIQKIGQGEHGAIYLAEYMQDGQKKLGAIKKVTYESKVYNDFQFSLLPKLDHPNIIKVFDYNQIEESQGDYCFQLLLEYASNGDLFTYTRRKYEKQIIPQEKLLKWLCQLCLGLHYLHNQMRVLHRDIKGKNVLVMENGLVKIADFGTARQLTKNQDFALTSVGTPYYLSPEAVRGVKYNNKSDIWGLGCIMFQLCTGKKPFQGTNLNDLIKEILSSEVDEIPEVYSEWLRNLIRGMLDKNPDRRVSVDNILQRGEIRQAFQQLKLQYQNEYKDFVYPIPELKTKKYCERQEKSRVIFCTQSLKTVKNEKNIKLQIMEWKNEAKIKPKKESKVADMSKLKNRSLKSIIEKRKSQRKDLEQLDKQSERNSDN